MNYMKIVFVLMALLTLNFYSFAGCSCRVKRDDIQYFKTFSDYKNKISNTTDAQNITKLDTIWGYTYKGKYFIKFLDSFIELQEVGYINYFTYSYNNEVQKLIIDPYDGCIYECAPQIIIKYIREYNDLLRKYLALPKQLQEEQIDIYIKELNKRHLSNNP